MLCPCKVTGKSHCVSQAERTQDAFSQQGSDVGGGWIHILLLPVGPFCTCRVLLDSFGTMLPSREPITDCAVKQLKVAVFGCLSCCNSLDYNLRVYCVDNTPWAFQVSLFSSSSCGVRENVGFPKIGVNRESDYRGNSGQWTHIMAPMGIPVSKQELCYCVPIGVLKVQWGTWHSRKEGGVN